MMNPTAGQYLQFTPSANLMQRSLVMRCHDYSLACRMWADSIATRPYAQRMDHVRCSDLARMSATLAFLAFPDLRIGFEIQEAA